MSHTPGPWHHPATREVRTGVGSRFEGLIHAGGPSNYGNCIAIVHMGGPGGVNHGPEAVVANARLIASAPELLEALQKFLSAQTLLPELSGPAAVEMIGAAQAARRAIAKALGGAL